MKKKKTMIPYGRHSVSAADRKAVDRVLRSDWLTQGPAVPEFEKLIAKKVGSKYAVGVSNGTAALHLCALALGLKAGDEVITTPISFAATSNAILYTGAKPVFVDVEEGSVNLDPKKAAQKITRKTKAIFVTHFAGQPANMKALNRLAKKEGLLIIEDACHALGARYGKKAVGSCTFSRAACFSFHPVKHITTGEGGMITTNDAAFYQKLCDLRSHGIHKDPKRLKIKDEGPWYYEMQSLGFNYRMSDLQAALGISQLQRLGKFIARRSDIARRYRKELSGVKGIALPVQAKHGRHAYHLFFIRLADPALKKKRRGVFEKLQAEGIGVQIHYIPIPRLPFYRARGYQMKDLPEAEAYYRETISIPVFPEMTQGQVLTVCRVLKNILKEAVRES